ncbi:MarR family transcriptional regulator [Rhodoplanes sp. TEM]|uniref:MarR family transcriptional regulator n=1 Tax=Rhodoplanes tepidamans TaxID=200616 RepID=A0ABT5JFL6_RHOTP|nr:MULTISPECIES: MarR family transcriptional regulator [Rhodoplanes]MDC7788362.1 MarR family transcriptional regulator [Rhodoplanes tepidamans]MDC7986104.1 MarR family transcriptional regulator [Rhodoplanes sp. TEM]MDQ0358843.1 DNA-binding MarR family transcriptional regulator [Rhodoplanes tepidamans]
MKAKAATQKPRAGGYCLDEQVGFMLRQVNQRHSSIFAEKIGCDLTAMQWAVLSKLREIGATSQNQLGRATAMDVATVKGVVDRLTGRGLCHIAADPDDARRRLVDLTAKGRALVDAHVEVAHAISDETLAPLTAAERRTFMSLLAKLR